MAVRTGSQLPGALLFLRWYYRTCLSKFMVDAQTVRASRGIPIGWGSEIHEGQAMMLVIVR
ncbi:MAG: hypothetical protein AB7P69_10920 [Candidatus Binatia bacterium]